MGKKSSKQNRIKVITAMLSEGLERRQILQKLSKTCKVSPRTIDNEIKEAKAVLAIREAEAEAIRLATTKEMTEEAVKAGLKSDLELELILSQIASGQVEVQEWLKGGVILRSVSPMEIIQATRTIFTKRGSNAPTKIASTDAEGNDVQPPVTLMLPPGMQINLPSNTEDET